MKTAIALSLITHLIAGTALAQTPVEPRTDTQIAQANWGFLTLLGLGAQNLYHMQVNCIEPLDCLPVEEDALNNSLIRQIEDPLKNNLFTAHFLKTLDIKNLDSSESLNPPTSVQVSFSTNTLRKMAEQQEQLSQDIQRVRRTIYGNLSANQTRLWTGYFASANLASINRARISSVKANMHTLQAVLETYGVDFGGTGYPLNLNQLYAEAIKGSSYWRKFVNPYTLKEGIGLNGALVDFDQYMNGSVKGEGLVLYKPELQDGKAIGYEILGVGAGGELINSHGELFRLEQI